MAYQVGGVTIQGDEPSNVIYAAFTPKTVDGGKARIKRRRGLFGGAVCGRYDRADLTMDHADPVDLGMPSDSAWPSV